MVRLFKLIAHLKPIVHWLVTAAAASTVTAAPDAVTRIWTDPEVAAREDAGFSIQSECRRGWKPGDSGVSYGGCRETQIVEGLRSGWPRQRVRWLFLDRKTPAQDLLPPRHSTPAAGERSGRASPCASMASSFTGMSGLRKTSRLSRCSRGRRSAPGGLHPSP